MLICLILITLGQLAGTEAAAQQRHWVPVGPRPNTRGQVEGIQDGEVDGAINALAPHPNKAAVLYVGTVNGGIWKTENATQAQPNWKCLTDTLPSLCIGALEFDPTDKGHNTLVAGTGQFSSIGDLGISHGSVLRTTDGGENWTVLGSTPLGGVNVESVAARGPILMAVGNNLKDSARRGLWRSTNTGTSWSRLSGAQGSGLPVGFTFALTGDRSNPKRFYVAVVTGSDLNSGIYRSQDWGETWERVGNKEMHAAISFAGRVKIAVGAHNNVYVAVVNNERLAQLSGVFRSSNGVDDWASMDLPGTTESGVFQGIHPGGQGRIHLSLAADPNDKNVVYIGGDRQPSLRNSIGAQDWSGRLFRGTAAAKGPAWNHLTHKVIVKFGDGGTANGSAPHADSRDMKFNCAGELLEADDGGVYLRTSPQNNKGDWFSRNGDLQVTEFHSVAWDPVSHMAIGGAQDTGSPEDDKRNAAQWRSVGTADGGTVAVTGTGKPNQSVRYSSSQGLGGRFDKDLEIFVPPYYVRRFVYNQNNVLLGRTFVQLQTGQGTPPIVAQFYTPIRCNAAAPERLIIGADNGVYESRDFGQTATLIGANIRTNSNAGCPIASGAAGNPDILYVGADRQVFVRTARGGTLTPATTFDDVIQSVVLDPTDGKKAYLVTRREVLHTADSGQQWTIITGNLGTQCPGTLRSVAYVSRQGGNQVVVGCDTGVFSTTTPGPVNWSRIGTGLPRSPVMQMEYSATDNLILAGTLGRGAWTFSFAAGPPAQPNGADHRERKRPQR